ncbi:MAG: NUDIX hydrolase [Desulfosalsimonas sp.]|uniref:NUDIX domain-containing protein n=1 Tax=Desulfosalsimonas sp. TaxID=3073848 RepID=UPI003970D503
MSAGNQKIRIFGQTALTDRKFVNLFEIRYSDRNGNERRWDFASRQNPPKIETGAFDIVDAVIIVPWHVPSGKLVVIREFRMPLNDYQYGFPAGLVDPGESPQQSAIRELGEETGLKTTGIRRTSQPIYVSSGLTDESIVMVYLDCDGRPSDSNTGSAEDIETVFLSQKEAADLCADSALKVDVKTWLVMDKFAATGGI